MQDFIKKELKVGCMLAPINIPIGMVIVYLITALFMGSFNDAFSLTALSIVCTAGIGLILWLPIWYWVGYAVVGPLRFTLSAAGINIPGLKKREPAPQDQSTKSAPGRPTLTRDQLALINYIKKAQTKGLTKEQIYTKLQSNGWTAGSIVQAFQRVENQAG
jgi:hypothetical protein